MPTCQSGVQQADNSVITETKLAMASRHVADGRRVLERQRALITSQRKAGLDTSASEELLDLFERTQAIFEDDLRAAERNEQSKPVRKEYESSTDVKNSRALRRSMRASHRCKNSDGHSSTAASDPRPQVIHTNRMMTC
jgi:hypothetical protein